MNKYVISEDIDTLLKYWCKKQGFYLPESNFFNKLRSEMYTYLERIFGEGNVDMISVSELTSSIAELIKKTSLFPVSIDKVYFPTQPCLEANRTVDLDLNNNGLAPRFGSASVQSQIEELAKICPPEIVLIDDVIFSGKGISQIVDLFSKHNIQVKSAISGIAIGDGSTLLKQKGIDVKCVRFYDKVVDEICERDFYPGVPMSGRLVVGRKINIGAPYLLPFGKPAEWASIPVDKEKEFSSFCLQQSIKLWKKIEEDSNRCVLVSDLDRKPFRITNKSICITEALKNIKWQFNK